MAGQANGGQVVPPTTNRGMVNPQKADTRWKFRSTNG